MTKTGCVILFMCIADTSDNIAMGGMKYVFHFHSFPYVMLFNISYVFHGHLKDNKYSYISDFSNVYTKGKIYPVIMGHDVFISL